MTTTPRDCSLDYHWSTVTYGTRPPHALLHVKATVVTVGADDTVWTDAKNFSMKICVGVLQ